MRTIPSADTARFAAVALCTTLLLLLGRGPAQGFTFDVPKPTGFVVDEAGALTVGQKKRLIDLNRELQEKTGAEIAVVVVRSTEPEPPHDYAMAIAESWKPGSAKKDNGVVFLVATEDRQMYILTGYGAEGPLPDGLVGEIRDRIVRPAFRAGDYGAGIVDASNLMASLIAKDAGVTLTGVAPPRMPQRRRRQRGGDSSILVLFILFFILRSMFRGGGRGGRGARRGHDALGGFLLGSLLGRSFGHGRHGGVGGGGFGGGGFGGGGGGFGGFGGGGFGGGGAGGSW